MKKFISILLAVLMLTAFTTGFQVSASALEPLSHESLVTDADGFTVIAGDYGDWGYEVWPDGTVSVTSYTGDDKELTIPDKVNGREVSSVGHYEGSFYIGNSVIEVMNIPSFITNITEGCMADIVTLKAVNVDSNNTKYSSVDGVLYSKGKWVIYAYPSEKTGDSFTIPPTVKRIGRKAFTETRLASVKVTNKVEAFGYGAFSDNESLKSVEFSDGLKNINSGAFINCALTSLYIPASVENIEEGAFQCMYNLHEVKIDSTNPNYCVNSGNLYTKDRTVLLLYPTGKSATSVTVEAPVKKIGSFAFCGNQNLNKAVVRDGVTQIGEQAFMKCDNLTTVVLPDSVRELGKGVFLDAGITSINIPAGVTIIPEKAFAVSNLNNIIIPGNVKVIEKKAFENSWKLQNVIVSDGVEYIGKRAFWGSAVKTVELADSVREIGESAFNSCENLVSIKLSNSLTTIPESAFNWSGLQSVTIPDSVQVIDKHAFASCKRLSSIKLSNSLTSISKYTFRGSALQSVIIPDSVEEIQSYAFAGCEKLESVTLSKNLKEIGSQAFVDCKMLTKIELPESLKCVNNSAFRGTALRSVTIPPSVYYIGGCAFGFDENEKLISDFVIYGMSGTEAQDYAEYWNIKFISTGNVFGDVNSDGAVSIQDATEIQKYIAGLIELTAFEKTAADLDGNGAITISDATKLQKIIAGYK